MEQVLDICKIKVVFICKYLTQKTLLMDLMVQNPCLLLFFIAHGKTELMIPINSPYFIRYSQIKTSSINIYI